jgi:hypothetical protein
MSKAARLVRLGDDSGSTYVKGYRIVKYLLLIYGNQEKWESIPADVLEAEIAKQDAFNLKYRDTGELLGAYGLGGTLDATLVRRSSAGLPAVTDGPYLEAKEYIASFYLLDVPSLERAHEIAADMPWAEHDPVEVWPVPHAMPLS